MLKNYFKIALRNLIKRTGYTVINLLGLTLGLSASILLILYLQHELTFDRFNSKYDRTYRIIERRNTATQQGQLVGQTSPMIATHILANLPEVETATRLFRFGRYTVEYKANRFYEGDYLFAEPSFFEVFDMRLAQGDPLTALAEPNSVILTPEAAVKYFGEENAIGKTVNVESMGPMKVTGILETIPANSHLQFNMLFSSMTFDKSKGFKRWIENWESDGVISYLVLREGADAALLQNKMENLIFERRTDSKTERFLKIQALDDIHLYSNEIQSDRNFQKSDPIYLYLFSFIALFILIIASINYVNLATARSMQRAREVGVRKAVGASLRQLTIQFITESVSLVMLSLVAAFALVESLLPVFNEIASKKLQFSPVSDPLLTGVILIFALCVGVLSGTYPAMHLSRLKIVDVFKGQARAGRGERTVRSGLVIGQFALSIVMIVVTIAAYRQLQFIQEKRLGFNSQQMVVIDINTGNVRKNMPAVKQAFADHPAVKAISVSSRVPGEWKDIEEVEANISGSSSVNMKAAFISIDEDFLQTYGITLSAGRNFSRAMGTDSMAVLVNESAVAALSLTDPIGQVIEVPQSKFKATIVGVVRDFHFKSLHEKIAPLVMGFLSPYGAHVIDGSDYFSVQFNAVQLQDLMKHLRQVGEHFDPQHPFEFNFLDEKLASFYLEDQRVSGIFAAGAALAVIIACMGLFSLAAFAAEQRRKELGIRKVLGASSAGLVMLLSRDFLKLVLYANVIGWPLAYFFIQSWLDNFAYRIPIEIGLFALAGFSAFVIAWVTVSWQAFKAASINPVEALKYE